MPLLPAVLVSKTALQPSELDQAEFIGEQLVNAVGVREQAPAHIAEVSLQRNRHFTLFVKAYDQVRRAISYLRWNEDDLERIAPSLYAGRNTPPRKSESGQPGTPPSTSIPAKPEDNAAGIPASPPATGGPGAAGATPAGNARPRRRLLLAFPVAPHFPWANQGNRSMISCPRSNARPSQRRSTRCSPPPPSPAGAKVPPLDVAEWLSPKQGRTPAVIVSVAHLEDEERALVLGVLPEKLAD